jgi:dCMP deaminase
VTGAGSPKTELDSDELGIVLMSAAPGNWDRRFLELAAHIGSWSKDQSAKTGCVIVGPDRLIRSVGYNGFVRGVDDEVDSRHERPAKYSWTEHAERNAIYNAARIGISLAGATCYVNWFPCADCARHRPGWHGETGRP